MIYEMRMYEAAPGKMAELHRSAELSVKIFDRHGIKQIGFWTAMIGVSNQLWHLLAFESLADRERLWAIFQADPDWVKGLADVQKSGVAVVRITNTILQPTAYSPLK